MKNSLFTDSMKSVMKDGFVHSYIAPVQYLDEIPTGRSCHLLLAHLIPSKEYCDYYRRRKEAGDVIIVDNGAFEFHKPMPVDEYGDEIIRLGFNPDVIVAPDYPFEEAQKTIDATNEFIEEVYSINSPFDPDSTKIMAVPQSKQSDIVDWTRCYRYFLDHPNISVIGMSILGVPNAFKGITGTDDISFNRVFATNHLKNIFGKEKMLTKWHHYLGCGDPREVLHMISQGIAMSNDSSSAVWHGILGKKYDSTATGLICGKDKTPVDFFLARDDSKLNDIRHNIMYMEDLICKGKALLPS